MNYYKIVEVLDLRTLNHYRFTDVHILRVCTAYDLTALQTADMSGSVYDIAVLNDPYRHCNPSLNCGATK